MKKLLLILAALAVTSSAVLTACNQKPVENVKTPENEVVESDNNEEKEQNTEPAKVDAELVGYNAEIEAVLEKQVPKSDLDKEVLGYINGLPNSAAQVKYVAVASKNMGDLSEEEIKKEIEAYYRQNAALISVAHEKGITFGDETDEKLITTAIEQMKANSGENYATMFEESPYTEYYYYLYQTVYSPIFSKLIDVYLENQDPTVYDKAVKYVEDHDYVRAKHILVMFPQGEGENGEITDAQKEETRKKANDILKEVKAMKDISEFDALIEKYNEDPGVQSNPNGYYFGKGEMVPEFETAAYELEVGKTSDVVETSYGCHILLKLPVFDEAFTESNLYTNATINALNEYLLELGDSYELVYADNYEERFAQFQADYEAMLAEAQAKAEEAEEAAEAETAE